MVEVKKYLVADSCLVFSNKPSGQNSKLVKLVLMGLLSLNIFRAESVIAEEYPWKMKPLPKGAEVVLDSSSPDFLQKRHACGDVTVAEGAEITAETILYAEEIARERCGLLFRRIPARSFAPEIIQFKVDGKLTIRACVEC